MHRTIYALDAKYITSACSPMTPLQLQPLFYLYYSIQYIPQTPWTLLGDGPFRVLILWTSPFFGSTPPRLICYLDLRCLRLGSSSLAVIQARTLPGSNCCHQLRTAIFDPVLFLFVVLPWKILKIPVAKVSFLYSNLWCHI